MNTIKYSGKAVVSLPVNDIAKSQKWYRDVLGFSTVRMLEDPPWCEMQTPLQDLSIGLAEVTKVRVSDTTLALTVTNLDECRAHLVAANADVSKINEVPGVARVFSTLDPDGHTIMFHEAAD